MCLFADTMYVCTFLVPCTSYDTWYMCICVLRVKTTFFAHRHFFSFRSGVCSSYLGRIASRGSSCSPRRKCGSRPGCVARALGIQRREIWQEIAGIAGRRSAEPEPSRTTGAHTNKLNSNRFSRVLCCVLCCVRATAGTSPGRLATSYRQALRQPSPIQ